MPTVGWIVAIVLAILLAFALYRPQVVKVPPGSDSGTDRPDDAQGGTD